MDFHHHLPCTPLFTLLRTVVWHLSLDDGFKEMPFFPASLVGRREEPTHSYQPSIQLILLLILRSVPQELEGEVEIARSWYVWDPEYWGEGLRFSIFILFCFWEKGRHGSALLTFPSSPHSSQSLDLGGRVVYLSFVRSFLTLVVLLP